MDNPGEKMSITRGHGVVVDKPGDNVDGMPKTPTGFAQALRALRKEKRGFFTLSTALLRLLLN